MFRRRKKHKVPGLNTTATADISFMLLVFFLVTTSMDSDKGLGRQLPPVDPEEQVEVTDVDKTKVLTIHLKKDGVVEKDEQKVAIDSKLRKDVRHFIVEKGPTHIIELQVDRNADYDTYFRIQNLIVKAYSEIRNAGAKKKYGILYGECNEEQREAITKAYPQRITETTIAE